MTKTYVEEFKRSEELGRYSDPDVFEMFCTYCAISEIHHDSIDITEAHTGGGADLGIDGIAIFINGAYVNSLEDVGDIVSYSGQIDVVFLFVQAKSASSFSGESISNFIDGCEEFFRESPELPMNDSVASLHEVMEEIYRNSAKFKKGKPVCRLTYSTTGRWEGDQHLRRKIDKSLAALVETNLFSDVNFTPMGADQLQEAYQRSKNSISAEFTFANKVLLPDIDGIDESYVGSIPAYEYLKIITDSVGGIRKSLFTDNVRDFQYYNPVNSDIWNTVNNESERGRFVVLNNGVTVVARSLATTRDKVTLTDYQIVNGCQTSHVLFESSDSIDETVHVPLKVIATSDEDIVNSIITATNRQTQVTQEDLYALSGFAKKLEGYFSAHDEKKRLYFERRSRQYSSIQVLKRFELLQSHN
ncbi:AIPR family protein [Rhodococcus koreensis]